MKKTLLALTLVAAVVVSVGAYSPLDGYVNMFTGVVNDLTRVVCDLVEVVKNVVGVAAVLVLVLAGANYVYHSNNPQERKAAKDRIIHVIIGLCIVLIAKTFVDEIIEMANYCP